MLQEARESAELMIKEANDLAESILEKQRQRGISEAHLEESWILKKAKDEVIVMRQQQIANAKITGEWIILSRKEQIISDILREAIKRLKEFTKTEKYLKILQILTTNGGIALGSGELEVILNEQDSTLPINFEESAEEIFKETGLKANLALSKEKIQAIGGVILKTANGKIIMDNTFEDLLRRKERELRFKISEILFK